MLPIIDWTTGDKNNTCIPVIPTCYGENGIKKLQRMKNLFYYFVYNVGCWRCGFSQKKNTEREIINVKTCLPSHYSYTVFSLTSTMTMTMTMICNCVVLYYFQVPWPLIKYRKCHIHVFHLSMTNGAVKMKFWILVISSRW